MLKGRVAMLVAAGVLAAAFTSCGSDSAGDGDELAAERDAGAAAVADESDIDYSGLAEYDCERLDELLDAVVGAGDHGGMPHAENWTAGTDYKGGCVFEEEAVSVEIHLAEPNEHSLAWSLVAPDRMAEREDKSVDVGDEAYLDTVGDGVALAARKGLVEVHLGAPISGDSSMDAGAMIALASAILEPWPSGLEAQESQGRPQPPDVPLPPGVVSDDLDYFDAEEFNEKVAAAGGDLEDATIDPEVVPSTFSVTFQASPDEARAYCEKLRAVGIDADLGEALAEAVGVPAGESEEGTDEDPCDLTDEEIVASVDRTIDEYTLSLMDWDDLVRQVQICRDTPARCAEE